MAVPYTFATATASIPLSQLDSNFATGITLGNTTVYLGNTTTSIGNLTLTNATISSVASTFPNSYLANSSITLGTTNVSLGGTATTLNGLTFSNVTISTGNVTVSSLTDSGLTSGRVTYAGTGGLLQDSANLKFDGTNLALAGTISTWDTFNGSFQIAGASLSGLGNNNTALASNAYYNGAWKYYGTASASLYQQNAGQHAWSIAGSGTAGNNITFTQAMILDASGNVGIGVTPNITNVGGTYKLLSVGTSGGSGIFMGQSDSTASGSAVAQFFGKTTGTSG